MSENEVLNNEGVETLSEVSYSNGNVLGKVVLTGVIIAAGVATVLYIKKRRAAKRMEMSQPVIVEEEKVSAKRVRPTKQEIIEE